MNERIGGCRKHTMQELQQKMVFNKSDRNTQEITGIIIQRNHVKQ